MLESRACSARTTLKVPVGFLGASAGRPGPPPGVRSATVSKSRRSSDVEFGFDDNRFVNLTAMWKAEGSDESKKPYNWRRTEGASFIKHRASVQKESVALLFRTTKGRAGETWAHWQVALAYAKYLSHEFHRLVIEGFRKWAEEEANPGLKIDRTYPPALPCRSPRFGGITGGMAGRLAI